MSQNNVLFGVDFKQVIGNVTKGQLNEGTLTRTEETGYNPVTDEPTTTVTDYPFEGIVEEYSEKLIQDGVVPMNARKILIIADSLDTEPETTTDVITIEGESFTLTGKPARDPAGATWEVQGRL